LFDDGIIVTLLTNYWRVIRGFNRDIWFYLCSWAAMAFGYYGIMGVLLNLFLLRLGYGPSFIGLLIGSGQLLWAALAIPAATVGLHIGPRNSMALGNTLSAIGVALIISVEALPNDWRQYWLVSSWMLVWIGAAFHTVNATPYLMNLSNEGEQAYAFAAQSSVVALFAFFGSVVAGFLPGLFSGIQDVSLGLPAPYRLGLWGAPVFFLLSAWAVMQARYVALPRPDRAPGTRSERPMAVLLFVTLTVFLMATVEGSVRSFFNVYLDASLALHTPRIGVIMGVGQLLPAVAALTAPVLMGWLGAGRTFSLTSIAAGLFMLPLAFVAHWAAAALAFVGIIGAVATSRPARNVFSQRSVAPEWRSTASAASTIGLGVGWAAVAVFGGFVIEAWGFGALFAIASVFGLVNALLLYLYVNRQRQPEVATSASD
jgi:MFS family permease